MGIPDPTPVVASVYRTKGHIPFPLPEDYVVIGLDESGCFPPNPREAASRFRKMIMYAAASVDPVYGLAFMDGTTRSVYTRDRAYPPLVRGLWTELNGIHSQEPGLRENSTLTRMMTAAKLIKQAGYDGTCRAQATIDRFWPETFDPFFYEMLEDLGVRPMRKTLRIEPRSDAHVPIVREAHIESRRLWSNLEQQRKSASSRVDISPQTLLEKMSRMKRRHPGRINALRETEFYEKSVA